MTDLFGDVTPDAKPEKEIDQRFTPFKEFAYQMFFEERGVHLVLGKNNLGPLKVMLGKTKGMEEYDLPHLQMYWLCFIRSPRQFLRQVPNPLRFFVSNIDSIAAQVMDSIKANGNGNGNGTAHNANREAAREFVRKKLQRQE